ncbi:response regulator [Candidatus Peregrinibacteria bacterium]|nr:response regulator [Candidatus Peregrinibacteria bacterium]
MAKIILLEDEKALGQIYQKKLEAAGHKVYFITTPEEAQETAKKVKADVVILDNGIKGRNETGIDIAPSIRKTLPKSKIIILSNYNQCQFEEQALKAGVDAYLVKIDTPPPVLIAYLKKLLH